VRKYRKKPVVIEAMQYVGTEECLKKCLEFLADGHDDFNHLPDDGVHIKRAGGVSLEGIDIPTLEGTMLCRPMDYIIKGVQGEFYPMKPDIFEQTYDKEGE